MRLCGGAAAMVAGRRLPVIAQDNHQGALVAAAGRSLGHHCIHCLAHRRARRLHWGSQARMSGARGTPHHIQAASGLGRSATVGTGGHAALILCKARHASARQPCSRLTASRAAARLPYVRVQLAQLRSHGRPGRAVDVPHMVHPQVVGHQHVPGARVRKRREQALL